jgi:hypothetical protein
MSRDKSPTARPEMNCNESAWTMYSLREIHLETKVKMARPAAKAHQDPGIRWEDVDELELVVVMEGRLRELLRKA